MEYDKFYLVILNNNQKYAVVEKYEQPDEL